MKLPIKDIKTNPKNPRLIKDDKFNKLVQSLKDFPEMADVREIVVNIDHVVLGGNMRLKAMQEAGWTEAPVKVVDWTQEKQDEFVVKDNASFGEWDWDELANQYEVEELIEWGVDLPESLLPEEEVEEDEAPEVSNEPPVSKLGEIYQLGRHRVMCGDSTVKENVELLMDGVKADMVFTDPPYGVDYDGGHAVKGRRREKLENDGTPDIYADSLPNAVELSKDGAAFYVWYSDSKSLAVLQAVLQAGLEVRNHIIWNKNMAQFGAIGAQYKSKHEPCLYMFKKGKSPKWYGANNEVSVWDINRATKNEFHPTQKPIELVARAINNNSKSGDAILDLFLGSGSTLIACEQTDRTCYGMELDPKYVDVIRKRYHKFVTGEVDGWELATPAII